MTIRTEYIYDAIKKKPFKNDSTINVYEDLYISANYLESRLEIKVKEADRKRPVLLLAGTSIPITDRVNFIRHIAISGFEVATIINPTGKFLDFKINPKKDRLDSLRDTLFYLDTIAEVHSLDIIAQSYSAFEVVRLLSENPGYFLPLVRSVILVNPPGFDPNISLAVHCHRFIYHHVLKGLKLSITAPANPHSQEYAKNEITGILNWTYQTIRNPTRTFKEVRDIIDFKLFEPIKALIDDYHYDFNVILNTEDRVLPYQVTLEAVRKILPPGNILLMPGSHNDIFDHETRRDQVIDFLRNVRTRSK